MSFQNFVTANLNVFILCVLVLSGLDFKCDVRQIYIVDEVLLCHLSHYLQKSMICKCNLLLSKHWFCFWMRQGRHLFILYTCLYDQCCLLAITDTKYTLILFQLPACDFFIVHNFSLNFQNMAKIYYILLVKLFCLCYCYCGCHLRIRRSAVMELHSFLFSAILTHFV